MSDEPAAARPAPESSPTAPAPVGAEAPPAPDAAKQAEAAKPADAANQATCNRGQWPYLESACGGEGGATGDQQKSIRVIGVDQTAPSSIVAEPSQQPELAKRGETGPKEAAVPAPSPATSASTPAPAAVATNDFAAPPVQTDRAAPVTAAPGQSTTATATPFASPPAEETIRTLAPAPAPDPRAKAKGEKPRKSKPLETPKREANRRDSSERGQKNDPESFSKRKPDHGEAVAQRHSRREDAERQPQPALAGRPARREQSDRQPRRSEIEERNEAEGFSVVRRHVLPDGRSVTVYRRYENEGAAPRRPSFGRTSRSLFDDGDDFD
jgi:hypothetical protein